MTTSSKSIALFSEGINSSLSMIDHGIIIDTTSPLYPVSKHRSERIFSLDSLAKYFYEDERVDFTTYVRNDQTKASSAFELSKTFETKVTASGQSSFLGTSLSSTAAVEYNYSSNTKKNVEFAQIKHLCEVATIDMPRDTEELRSLLDDKFKENIDSVASIGEARKFVKRYGALFITEASWGGSLTLTTSSQITETTTETNLLTSLEAELKFLRSSASTSASTSNGVQESERNENFRYKLVGIGGKPHLVNDPDGWMESVAEKPALVDIKVGDISTLAIEDSMAQDFLRDAVEEYCSNHEDFFGNQLFLKTINHFSRYHWKKKDMLKRISDHKNWCEHQMRKAKSLKPGIANKKGRRRKRDYEKAAQMGIDLCYGAKNRLKSSNKQISEFLMYLNRAKASNQRRINAKKYKKELNIEHIKLINELKYLTENAGTLGLSNTSISFWNSHHSRFLKLDEDSVLKSGNVAKNNILSTPDESKFVLKVLDHAKGQFCLYNNDQDAYLEVHDDQVKCTKVTIDENKLGLNFRFNFIATTSGIQIKSLGKSKLLQLSPSTFEVNLVESYTKGSVFLLTETA